MLDTELPKTVFAAQLRTIEPTEGDLQEAKASLGMLQSLLPPGVNPEDEPDLLFIVANVAVAGLVNLNDDGMTIDTALAVYKKFEKKFVDLKHDRDKVRGYILHAGLSEFGTDRVITEDEARAANKPFNIATVAVLWKAVDRELCDYLIAASNPAHPDFKKLSLSFEMAFAGCSIITLPLGEREIVKATQVIMPDGPTYERYLKALRANKGDGISPDNPDERVYRILPPDAIPLGQGVVSVPAAQVRGIQVIDEPVEAPEVDEPESVADMSYLVTEPTDEVNGPTEAPKNLPASLDTGLADDMDASLSYTKACFNALCDKLAQIGVSRFHTEPTPLKPMKLADLPEVKKQAAAATKLEDLQTAFANVAVITEVLAQEAEGLNKALDAQKNVGVELEKARVEAVAAHSKLAAEFAEVKKELDVIKVAQASAAAEATFAARMTALDDEFELTNDERALFVDDARTMTDEVFAAKFAKDKVLMKDKSKKNIADKKTADKAKEDKMCAALAAKGIKYDATKDIDFVEILASATRVDQTLPNGPSQVTNTLVDQAKSALAGLVIGGKTVAEWQAAKQVSA